jgi:hypothetical protein
MANIEAIIEAARDLLLTIDSMHEPPPDELREEIDPDSDPAHWYGGFSAGVDVTTVYEPRTFIEWPNLAISVAELRAALERV